MIDWQELEDDLIRYVYKKVWDEEWRGNDIPKHVFKSFLSNVSEISAQFTDSRKNLRSNYLDDKEGRYGYLLYFHLANVARNLVVFEEMHRSGLMNSNTVRVLDYGTGLGSSIWALCLAMKQAGFSHALEFVAMDRSKKALQDAQGLLEALVVKRALPVHHLSTKISDAFDPRTASQLKAQPPFDMVMCSNMLNELVQVSFSKALDFLRLLLDRLNPEGCLVLIEPALSQTARQMTLLRDKIIQKENCYAPLPCGHDGPCPLNREPRDWCHFQTFWNVPKYRKKFENALGHQSGSLKYAYLVLTKTPPPEQEGVYRVISDRLHEKDGTMAWLLCFRDVKYKLVLSRDEAKSGVFRSLSRGDRLRVEFQKIDRRKDLKTYAVDVRLKRGSEISRIR